MLFYCFWWARVENVGHIFEGLLYWLGGVLTVILPHPLFVLLAESINILTLVGIQLSHQVLVDVLPPLAAGSLGELPLAFRFGFAHLYFNKCLLAYAQYPFCIAFYIDKQYSI